MICRALIFLIFSFSSIASQARVMVFIGGAGMVQAKADIWCKAFQVQVKDVEAYCFQGPQNISKAAILTETSYINKITNQVRSLFKKNPSESVEIVAHSSGAVVADYLAKKNEFPSMRIYILDGFKSAANQARSAKAHEIFCIKASTNSGLLSLNYNYYDKTNCTDILDLRFDIAEKSQMCLHYYLINKKRYRVTSAAGGKIEKCNNGTASDADFEINLDWYDNSSW